MPRVATYVFIDLETTGIPCQELNKTRITEISMVAVKSSHILDTRAGASPRVQNKITLCLNPRRMVHPGSTDTTGLCNDLLEQETHFNINVFNILDTFLNVLTKPVCLIAHNGFNFDFPILKKHLEDLSVSFNEELLCADSYFAFYDILEENNRKETEAIKRNEELSNKTVALTNKCEESPNKSTSAIQTEPTNIIIETDFMSMQKRNETTPKQQMIRSQTPLNRISKARKRFPWSDGTKPCSSYKLKHIYERLLNRPALNAHRAEVDCILMMEAAVAISKQFVPWVAENHKLFSEVKAMTIGVPLGELALVALLWGGTNPFIRRGTRGLRDVHAKTSLGQVWAELGFLLGNWRYVLPWLINQLGSLVYVCSLQGGDLTLTVPVANGLTFAVTAVTGAMIGEEVLCRRSMFGVLLIVAGTMLCCMDKG